MKFKVYTEYRDFAEDFCLYIVEERPDGRVAIAKPVDLEFEVKERGEIRKPTMVMYKPVAIPFLQSIANACEKIGILPEGKPILENELTATKYHLEDMRKITFALTRRFK
jgi:hypothetical protein